MFEVADLRERVILSMATDLGQRTVDFINIKKKDLPNLNQETPITFEGFEVYLLPSLLGGLVRLQEGFR